MKTTKNQMEREKSVATRRRHGLEYQRWCKAWIEKHYPGSMVHNQPLNHVCISPGKWICKSNDIFGCIDLVAIVPHVKPMFIQCSAHSKVEERLEEFRKIPWDFRFCHVQLWQKMTDGRTVVRTCETNAEGTVIFRPILEIVRGKPCPPKI